MTKALPILRGKKALSPTQAEQACWEHSPQTKQKYPSRLVSVTSRCGMSLPRTPDVPVRQRHYRITSAGFVQAKKAQSMWQQQYLQGAGGESAAITSIARNWFCPRQCAYFTRHLATGAVCRPRPQRGLTRHSALSQPGWPPTVGTEKRSHTAPCCSEHPWQEQVKSIKKTNPKQPNNKLGTSLPPRREVHEVSAFCFKIRSAPRVRPHVLIN